MRIQGPYAKIWIVKCAPLCVNSSVFLGAQSTRYSAHWMGIHHYGADLATVCRLQGIENEKVALAVIRLGQRRMMSFDDRAL